MTNPAHNIYVHVPFCVSKCKYCAFMSAACANPDWGAWADGIGSEIDFWRERVGAVAVPTIFFGGGTPSLMPVEIFSKIMSHLQRNFHISPDAEITIESNPGTIDDNKLAGFIAAGVNRLSIGAQRMDDDSLQFLGRRHGVNDAMQIIDAATRRNIRVSADFIYGIPGDTAESVRDMCCAINRIGLGHVSMYELTIEENTPFAKMDLNMPDNDAMADMYGAIEQTLNLARYEVSNYAAHGNECRHNANIWDGAPYIGIGRGAAGRVFMNNTWYEQVGGNIKYEKMTNRDRAIECVITGMRTTRGVRLTPDVQSVINTENVASGMICINNGRMRATRRGIMLLDDILPDLVR